MFAVSPMNLVAGATHAFAPALSGLEPTREEAMEEYARARTYRRDAFFLGVVGGGALGLLFLLGRRR